MKTGDREIGGAEMRIYITAEQAISVLPEGDCVHTFYNPGFGLMGADWSKEDITDKLRSSDIIELTGPVARGMGHGICAYNKDTKDQGDILFIETDEGRVSALEKEMEALKDGKDD